MDAMNAVMDVADDPRLRAEFHAAFARLYGLIDWETIDDLMPMNRGGVYTAGVVCWLLVYQRMHASASLADAVEHFISTPPEHCPRNKRTREKTLSNNTSGYNEGRQRLTLDVTATFVNTINQSLIDVSPPSFAGRRVFTIDGTTTKLAPIPQLRKLYPPASNQHGEADFPVALILVAHELASGVALIPELGAMYGPNAVSETALVPACVARLPARSVVMADRNFGIFSVAHHTLQAGHDFVFRMTGPRFNALRKKARLISKGSRGGIGWQTYEHRWHPSGKDRKTNPDLPAEAFVDVRLQEIRVHENLTLWLVTSLTEGPTELAALYQKRGDVEIDIRNFKVVLGGENIRAQTAAMFQKELWTSVVAYNLVCQFRRQAANLAKVPARKLSFTRVWTTFREYLWTGPHDDPAYCHEQYRRALHYASRNKLPNRPGRNYKREAYHKTHKSTHYAKRERPK